ncbi:hypothetical protein ACF0H5_013906 [Mactra antiquata]
MAGLRAWLYFVFLTRISVCVNAQSDQCSGLKFSIIPDADYKFSVVASIRRTNFVGGEKCGSDLSTEAIEDIATIQWVVERMNANNYPASIKLGFDVYDDCGIAKKALSNALDILDTPILGTKECASNNNTACTVGVIGASRSPSTESLLNGLDSSNVPVIGTLATLPSLSKYQHFYRTVATNDHQVNATVKLLNELNIAYIAIVHTNSSFGRYSANRLKEISRINRLCVDSVQELQSGQDIREKNLTKQLENTKDKTLSVVFFGSREVFNKMKKELDFLMENANDLSWIVVEDPETESAADNEINSNERYPNQTFVISPSKTVVAELKNYIQSKWNSIGNTPNDDLEHLMKLSGVTNAPSVTFKNTAATIDAVFLFTQALHDQYSAYLDKREFREYFKFRPSDAYQQYNDPYYVNITIDEFAANNRTSKFSSNGEFQPNAHTDLYSIKFIKLADQSGNIVDTQTIQVGNYRNNSVYFQNTSIDFTTLSSSKCNKECAMCDEYPEIPFAFLDGDAFILGIFSVHETDPEDPFKCSTVRIWTLDILLIETFFYSIKQAREDTNIKFGAIAIDDCYSSAHVALVLTEVLSGKVKLKNPYNGQIIDVNKIAAVFTLTGSSVSIQSALILTERDIPVISASASSPDLDDRLNFPYFLRTVPSDVEQARAMVRIIKHMGWQYVSVLYVENNYGAKGKEAFLRLAKENGICVAEEAQGISDVEDGELSTVFTELSNQYSDVVVYFGTELRIAEFLEIVDSANKFVFLGSEDWGQRKHVLDSGKDGTLGSITLTNDVDSLVNNPLEAYFKTLRPETVSEKKNPWFVEFWEESFKCDLPQSFRNKHNRQCDDNVKFTDEQINDFVEDHRIAHTSKAIKALTLGLKKSKEKLCKYEQFPCSVYFKFITEAVGFIREVELPQGDVAVRVFDDNNNGNIGFRINNIQRDANNKPEYKTVGLYKDNELTLDKNNLNFYKEYRHKPFDGTCHKPSCDVCSNETITTSSSIVTTTHVHNIKDEFGIPDFTIIGILGFIFIVSILIAVIIIRCLRKRIIELENKLKEIKYEIRTGTVYPPLKIANPGPSGGSMYEWKKAQYFLNGGNSNFSNGGVVNRGFERDDMYIHAKHDENDNQQEIAGGNVSPRRTTSTTPQDQSHNSEQTQSFPDSPTYRPPSSSYGISTHHSFKKPSDQNGGIKMQPRTQLAVPPCRPELPPRGDQEQQRSIDQRQNDYAGKYDHLPAAVPKEKVRKVRSSPKRNFSPPSLKQSPLQNDYFQFRDNDIADSPKYNGASAMTFADTKMPSSDKMQINGSMERISRV